MKITNKKFDFEKYLDIRWYLFGFLCVFSVVFSYIINDIIITDPQYYTGGNENSASLFRNVYVLIYFVTPIIVFVKAIIITQLLKIAANLIFKITIEFKRIFTLVVIASAVFLISDLIQIV